MAIQKIKKGLPRRAARDHSSHARRERSKTARVKRAAHRRAAQAGRERANRERGGPTPWEEAKAARKARRAADPAVQLRAKKWKEGVV